MPRALFWIAEIRITPDREAKIRERRFLTGAEVREACIPDAYERAAWEQHPTHGLRLIVLGRTHAGKRLRIVLEPVDPIEGIWKLRTVIHHGKER